MFSFEPAPNGARKLISTHREANPTAALAPGEYLVNAAYGLSNLTKKVKVESGRSLVETFVLNAGGLKLGAVLANGQALPAGSVHFDILSDEEDQFGKRRTILGNAKPGVVIRLNAGAYHIVSLYGRANATVRADVTVEPGKITDATIKHAAAPVTFRLVQKAGRRGPRRYQMDHPHADRRRGEGSCRRVADAYSRHRQLRRRGQPQWRELHQQVRRRHGRSRADRGGHGPRTGDARSAEGDHRTAATPAAVRDPGGEPWRTRTPAWPLAQRDLLRRGRLGCS